MIYQNERPHTFDGMIGQNDLVDNIRNQSIRNSWFSVYILEGQYGSGKTTIARIIALAANCKHKDENGNPCLQCENCREILSEGMDYWEIDGADNSSVEDIRNLKEYVGFLPSKLDKKIVIIDEVHMLSKSAFNCMLKMLEEPPSYVIFILCTTDLEVIPMTVRSRAAGYSFNRISQQDICTGLEKIAPKYGIELEEGACRLLAHYSDGSMRNALVLLEQVSVAGSVVDEEVCKKVLGIMNEDTLMEIVETLLQGNLTAFISQLDIMEQTGKSFSVLGMELLKACADLTMASCNGSDRVAGTSYYQDAIQKLSDRYRLSEFCTLATALRDVRIRTQGSSKYEFLVYMVTIFEELAGQGLSDRVRRLEECYSRLEGELSLPAEKVISGLPPEEPVMEIDHTYSVPGEETAHGVQNPQNMAQQEGGMDFDREEDDDFYDGLFEQMNQSQMQQYMSAGGLGSEEGKPFFSDEERSIKDTASESQMGDFTVASDIPFKENPPEIPEQPQEDAKVDREMETGREISHLCARDQFEQAIAAEPILMSRYRMSCRVEESAEGIKVLANNQAICTQLLMFVASKEIKNVEVEFNPE